MKLASIINKSRDGELVVVSRDLTVFASARHISPTMQYALDNWDEVLPELTALYSDVNAGKAETNVFEQNAVHSPLPRAYQWADGSAYVNHVELVRKARGAEIPESFWTDPLMYQGGSDSFLNPYESIKMPSTDWGIDMEGEVAVVTADVPLGATVEKTKNAIRLIMLVNDVSLRALIPAELAKGFGFFQSKPSSAFSPVAVTPDELGDAWDGQRVCLPLLVEYNGKPFGKANAGVDMTFDFPTLIAHAAKSRPLTAGTIVGSGTVSNKLDGEPGKPIAAGGVGYSCIAEIRMIETIDTGKPTTPFMQFGDSVCISMNNAQGESVFGEIRQTVEQIST